MCEKGECVKVGMCERVCERENVCVSVCRGR